MNIIECITDPQLLNLTLSPAQEALLRAIYGLPMSEDHLAFYRACTGRQAPPQAPFSEATVIAGARAGKDSRIAAPVVCYEAVFGQHERHLARGERAVIPLVAQDARAARIAFGYVKDYITSSPLLASMVEEVLASEIALMNGVTIMVFPCTLRSLRGWSIPVGVLDELAFFRLEGQADSDVEIQASMRRGMINFPATRLVKISTPYMKGGVLYDDFKRGFGRDHPDILVWRASSLLMNPSLRAERLSREERLDPLRFQREYMAEFAEDVDAFLPSAWVDQAIISGRHELGARNDVRYIAAVDPSGGGDDTMTLAIVHVEEINGERRIVQDVMRGWATRRDQATDLEGAVREIAAIARAYDCRRVYGDRYASAWVRERFRANVIQYVEPEVPVPGEPDAVKYLDKSSAYLEVEPLFAQGRIDLLEDPALEHELKRLERRPRVGGKTLVDHPTGGHDDYANAVALAAAVAIRSRVRPVAFTPLPEGIARVGEPVTQVGKMVSGNGQGVRLGARVGGQAAWISRRYGGRY